jgi:hypothetical protein
LKILSFMWNPLLLVTKVATMVAIVLKNGLVLSACLLGLSLTIVRL